MPLIIPSLPNHFQLFVTAEELEATLKAFAKEHRFNFLYLGASNRRNGKNGDGQHCRVDLCCAQGNLRSARGAGLRATHTKKAAECPWRAKMVRTRGSDWQWFFQVLLGDDGHPLQHNHEPTQRAESHPGHRGISDESRQLIEASVRDHTSRPSTLRTAIRKSTGGKERPTVRDINNVRNQMKVTIREGFTSTQAFIRRLRQKAYWHKVRWENDDRSTNRPIAFFWTMPYCVQMWQRYPQVLSIDNTYKTNKFKMPFFSCTGQAGTGSVFNRAFGLTLDEQTDSCRWAIECLVELQEKIGAAKPKVIITDFDDIMREAISTGFPMAQQQLCIFHINKNVVWNVARKWKDNGDDREPHWREDEIPDDAILGPDEQYGIRKLNSYAFMDISSNQIVIPAIDDVPLTKEGMYELWELVTYAPLEARCEGAWNLLHNRFFSTQKAVVRYLYETYIGLKEEWAACYIRGYRNYGTRTTSPTETTHKALKSYILDGRADLLRLQVSIEELLEDQQENYELRISDDALKVREEWLGKAYLGILPGQVTRKALKLINVEFKIASTFIPTASRPCPPRISQCNCDESGTRASLGICCYHEIYRKISITEENLRITPIVKDDIDNFWYTEVDMFAQEPDLAILDPPMAVPKGRPATGTAVTLNQAIQKGGRRAGGRATRKGGGLAPSQRRNRSQWEAVEPVHRSRKRQRTSLAASPPVRDCIVVNGEDEDRPRTELRLPKRTRPHLMVLRGRGSD